MTFVSPNHQMNCSTDALLNVCICASERSCSSSLIWPPRVLCHENVVFKRRHVKGSRSGCALSMLSTMRCSKSSLVGFADVVSPRATFAAACSSACPLRSRRRLRAEPCSSAGVTSSLYATGERCEPPGARRRRALQPAKPMRAAWRQLHAARRQQRPLPRPSPGHRKAQQSQTPRKSARFTAEFRVRDLREMHCGVLSCLTSS